MKFWLILCIVNGIVRLFVGPPEQLSRREASHFRAQVEIKSASLSEPDIWNGDGVYQVHSAMATVEHGRLMILRVAGVFRVSAHNGNDNANDRAE